ncbi:SusC/RagA family TonB-linked outer membrane protein, partial [Pelobium sp.]|nr:SusC/RagA family TonB-linked outer membrane protein [Pelobium sp.]
MLRKLTMFLFLMMFFGTTWSQITKISGIIKDDQGEPLIGASVQNPTQKIILQTNLEGKFTIPAKVGESLTISFTGFETKIIKIDNLSPLNVVLIVKRNFLEEVVVSGYGIQTARRDYTGASSKIDKSSIVNTAPVNISEVLQGRAAGVNVVSNDGAPGSGFSINIRGNSSITAGGQPLFVVDNIPFVSSSDNDVNPLASINPKDIESIDILKDASATALYGVGASNGVIVITTKKGTEGKPKINFSTKVGTGKLNGDLGILSSQDYALFRANNARNFTNLGTRTLNTNENKSPGAPNVWEIIANPEASKQYLGGVDPNDFLKSVYGINNYTQSNWLDLIVRNNFKQFYDLSFSGATKDGTSYFASIGTALEQGSLIGSGFKRYSSRLNLDQNFGKIFKAGLRLQYTNSIYDGSIGDWTSSNAINQATFLNPFLNRDNISGSNTVLSNNGFGVPRENPEFKLKNTYSNRNGNNFNINLNVSAKPLKWLELNFTGGITTDKTGNNQYFPSYTLAGLGTNGRATLTNTGVSQIVLQPRVSINKWFNKDNIFNASFIFETKQKVYNQLYTNYTQFLNEALGINSIPFAQTVQSQPTYSRISSVSYIGNAQYNFKSKYILKASTRIDQSSIFLKNRTGIFPSVSFAWNMADEKFMEFSKKYLSLLKFRVGYGVTGNDQIRNNSGIPLAYKATQLYSYNDGIVAAVNPDVNLANQDISWETTYGTNIGLDFGFLNDRITFSTNYYRNRTNGLLIYLQLPAYSSFTNVIKNIGSLQNSGFEFEAYSNNITNKNFSWTTNFNISFNRNKVLNLGGAPELGF